MKRGLIVLFFLMLLIPFASANQYSDLSFMTIEQSISNEVNIIPLKQPIKIDYFESTLYLVPQNSYRQNIKSTSFSPNPYKEEQSELVFRFEEYPNDNVGFNIKSEITTSGDIIPVSQKVYFPLTEIPNEITKYTEFTETIDNNLQIKQTANSLANGVDDLYELEFNIAMWVEENVQYNLSSLTANANKPSSWVIQEKRGVCDEISNLFISLNRALGVPARFVSGVAYTDSELFDEPWGNHGWAEVYFPNIGWVPFDISYKQLGYVDATHISLRKDVDGASHSVLYSHKGLQDTYSVESKALEFDSRIISKGNSKTKILKSSLTSEEDTIGFGSYDVLNLEIENTQKYYVIEFVQMANTIGIDQITPLNKFILLKPNEKKTISYLIKTSSNLESNLIYTYPFTAYVENVPLNTKVTVLDKGEIYQKNYMDQFLNSKKDSIPIEVSCLVKDKIMLGSNFDITCSPFESASLPIRVCLESSCKKIETHNQSIIFSTVSNDLGIQTIKLLQAKSGTSADLFVTYKAIDNAKLNIANISLEPTIRFDEEKSLLVQINKTSFASATNVTIRVKNDMFIQEWTFPVFDENKKFEFVLRGKNLGLNENEIFIEVEYTDSFGDKQSISKSANIKLIELTSSQKAMTIMNTINAKSTQMIIDALNLDRNNSNIELISTISITGLILAIIIILKVFFSIIRNFFFKVKTTKDLDKDYEKRINQLKEKKKIKHKEKQDKYKPTKINENKKSTKTSKK